MGMLLQPIRRRGRTAFDHDVLKMSAGYQHTAAGQLGEQYIVRKKQDYNGYCGWLTKLLSSTFGQLDGSHVPPCSETLCTYV